MRLRRTRKSWDKYARNDPLWSILTEDSKRNGRWNLDEFFASGRQTIQAEVERVRRHCPGLPFGSALDFGCGVGRLSQALALHFEQVTGVDISASMLEHAERFNRHGNKVAYQLNTQGNLGRFSDDQFDFVYSLITLQHMDPRFAAQYIKEFVRVTAPGGVILFQLPALVRREIVNPRPFTLWPDTLLKRIFRDLKAWWANRHRMEMNAIPRDKVEALLRSAGAEILDVYRYDAADAMVESWEYLARKSPGPVKQA